MAEPSSYPEWASNYIPDDWEEPTPAKKASGWTKIAGVPEKPPYQYFNWFQRLVYDWIVHLKEEAVTFTGVKTFSSGIKTDEIYEKTAGAGVTLDGVQCKDGNVVLNKGGAASSGGGVGINIEEGGSNTGYVKVSSDRLSWDVKAPASANVGKLTPTADSNMLYGMAPLGAVVALGNAAAWTAPTAGQVIDGWALCNGQAFSALGGGNYNASFSGNMPTLTDSRFLMGSTSIGSTGGANSLTLSSANIPLLSSLSNSASHSHAISISSTIQSAGHSHVASSAGAHTHNIADGLYVTSPTTYSIIDSGGADGDFRNGVTGSSGAHTHVTTVQSANHTHSVSGVAGSNSATHTHSVGNASPTAIENRPLYFSVIYIMRVK